MIHPISTRVGRPLRIALAGTVIAVCATGCSFSGLNNMPVPGAQGTDSGAYRISALIPSAAGLVANAPVMMDDATVGSVGAITVKDWNANVVIRLNEGTRIPKGSHVMVGMTSVLGSSHLEVVQPENPPGGMMVAGDSIPLTKCPEQKNISTTEDVPTVPDVNKAQEVAACTYPTTEQVLSSLSVVLNGGGINQLGDIVHEMNSVFVGRDEAIRKLVPRLNTLVSDLDRQKDNIIAAIDGLNRLSQNINDQTPTVERALQSGPQILQLLVDQRPHFTTALDALGRLSTTANEIITANDDDIKTIVSNLAPVLDQLQSTGPSLTQALSLALTFPFVEDKISTIVRGDYVNGDLTVDLTTQRLSQTMLASVGLVGPEGIVGSPAGQAKRGLNPFTSPLEPGGEQSRDADDPAKAAGEANGTARRTPATATTKAPATSTKRGG